jgi:serine/threonine protein kinase
MDHPGDFSSPNYSVGFEVVRSDGQRAFMKASDLSLSTNETFGMLERMTTLALAQNFERAILDHCRGNNMDRVVVAIDYGDMLIEVAGYREPVFFLIFEMAECDLRVQIRDSTKLNLVSMLRTLHNLAVGLQQLHKGNVCHNDIKPANILVYTERLQKVADLGKATSPLHPAIHDEQACAGDPQYAAPELLYFSGSGGEAADVLPTFDKRRAADLYQLGSVAFFMLLGRMVTPQVILSLRPEHCPPTQDAGWQGKFCDVLPFWRTAFAQAAHSLDEQLKTLYSGERLRILQSVLVAAKQLCEPDPNLRGHPHSVGSRGDNLSIERYISLFNGLRLSATVRS